MSIVYAASWALGLALCFSLIISTQLTAKQWLMLDAVFTSLTALFTLSFPTLVQEMETTGIAITPLHCYLAAGFICFMLMPTIAYLLLKNSSDPACDNALLFSRFVGMELAAMISTYHHFTWTIFTTMNLAYVVMGCGVLALASGLQWFRLAQPWQPATPSKVNLYLNIDVFLAASVGLWDMFCPQQPFQIFLGVNDPDSLALHLFQVGECLNVGSAVLSYLALSFRSDDDKKAVLKSRMAICALRFAIRTYSYLVLEPQMTFFIYLMFCLGYLPFFPAYLGICQTGNKGDKKKDTF